MTLSPAEARDAVIRTPADLARFWAALMGDGGFGRRTLWIAFFDEDGRPLPTLMPIDDVPRIPDRFVDNLGASLAQAVVDVPVSSVAMLLCRPGPRASSGSDRRWGRALLESCADVPVKIWPVHLATDDRISPLTPSGLG